jgi:DNA primase
LLDGCLRRHIDYHLSITVSLVKVDRKSLIPDTKQHMDAVEEVKSRLAIEDVIGEYVQLKRAGRNFKGMSPFSSEKSASFMVSPEKQIWHDFSSGKGGNMFSFVMEMEGLTFREALELLARKAGVDLEQFGGPRQGGGQDKERLYSVLDLAAKFYQVQFSKSQTALEYVLQKRKFTKETALEWRLGYSPNTGKALLTFLLGQGFKASEIKKAGLTAERRDGTSDMFRGRLMIPLADAQGRIIGFTARILEDDPNAPKYINTPQTPLYDKSRHVYGLHLAKDALRTGGYAVVSEGNLDVIASHQAGVRQVVATAGTALTDQHLKALSRFTGDIRLCFDADKAGVAATERAIPIASKVGVSLSIIDIPSGKDPDELIKQDVNMWKTIIEQPKYALDWLMDRYQKLLDISSAQGKKQFSDVLLPVVRQLQDSVEQDHYLRAIADKIGVSQAALDTKFDKTPDQNAPRIRRNVPEPKPVDASTAERTKLEEHFLSLMLMQPTLRQPLKNMVADMLHGEQARELLMFFKAHPDFDGSNAEQIETLRPLAEYSKILGLEYEELYQGLDSTELQNEATRLQARLIEQYVKRAKQQIAKKLDAADEATTQSLLTTVSHLDALLKTIKGGMYG